MISTCSNTVAGLSDSSLLRSYLLTKTIKQIRIKGATRSLFSSQRNEITNGKLEITSEPWGVVTEMFPT